MVEVSELVAYCNTLLTPEHFQDYCPNGLQVAGRSTLNTLVTGVTANQALLDAAIAKQADAILVHHGYFWRGESPCVTGIHRHRLATLLTQDLNLIAYHLPLDAHARYGNNFQLAQILGFEVLGQFSSGEQPPLSWLGRLQTPSSGEALAAHINHCLKRQPLHIPGNAQEIKTVAWCTGAAQDFIESAALQGADAFLTGEVSERTVNIAREMGIHFYACGHHATERYGVKALGEHLADQFSLTHHFIDIDNPV